MAVNKTSLSAGAIIRSVLMADSEVTARTNKIFPIVSSSAELPYIVYRRAELEVNPQKSGLPGSDVVQLEITCYASKYAESVELAEAVRNALDFHSAEHEGLALRACYLSGSEEDYQDDAFVQQLIFSIRM